MATSLTVRQRMAEKARAKKFVAELRRPERGDLMDQMVLGNVDYLWWFTKKPTGVFLNAVFDELQYLEETQDLP